MGLELASAQRSEPRSKGGAIATKTVKVSDLSGQIVPDEEHLGRLVVEAHPAFQAARISLDVLPAEVEGKLPDQEETVVLAYYAPGDVQPRRFLMPVAAFERLAERGSMTDVLETALQQQEEEERPADRPRRRRGGRATGGAPKIDYASPEHAGEPHKGWVSEAEKAYVREHLADVNARLAAKGLRQIDPTDPQLAKRYGLTAEEAA
jgi:hypothetical protein